jgi:hypothetical protein
MLEFAFVFGLGFATGWILFEKPEVARNAWDWVKAKFKGAE